MVKNTIKKVLFVSTPDFSDNPRAMYEYAKKYFDFELVWMIRDKGLANVLDSFGIDFVLENTNEAKQAIEQADLLITSNFDFTDAKKSNQFLLSTWHGFGPKLIGFYDTASQTNDFISLKKAMIQTDMVLASSRMSQITMAGMLQLDPRKIKITGFPRNDFLYSESGRSILVDTFGNSFKDGRIIFYLPTMRKGLKQEGETFQNNIFNYADFDCEKLQTYLEQTNTHIIMKVHFADNQYYSDQCFDLPKNVHFLTTEMLTSKGLTIYHILNGVDFLMTDYSSIAMDFVLLDKPIIYSCPDLEAYREDRGFILDNPLDMMNGMLVQNQKELIDALTDYQPENRVSLSFFQTYQDGCSSKRAWEAVFEGKPKDVDKELIESSFLNDSRMQQYAKPVQLCVYRDTGTGFNEAEKEVYSLPVTQTIDLKIDVSNSCLIRIDLQWRPMFI